ncbi:MAG: LptF/LptG family permease [Gemmatimonadota bacterium]|nr:LptF/LptG family permease [Gemmatimonadota bacterium]
MTTGLKVKILTRYILREHVGPLLFALAALTSLLLLNQVAKRFGDLVGKGLAWSVIGEFFLLSLPFIITMTIPMAVLVAVLYAFSRLASENEVTALKANGIGIVRLITPVLWGGFAMSLVMLAFNDQVLPRTNHRLRTLEADIGKKKPTFALREQEINEVSPGKLYLRAGHIDEATNGLREVVIYDMGDPVHRRTIYADSGRMGLSPDFKDLDMTLFNGYSEESPKDKPGELQRVYFTADNVRVKGVSNKFEATQSDDFKSEREMSVCEMTHVFEQNYSALEDAKSAFASAVVGTTRRVATGETVVPPPTSTTHRRPFGIGRVYCGILGAAGLAAGKATYEPPGAAAPGATTPVQQPSFSARPPAPGTPQIAPGAVAVAPPATGRPPVIALQPVTPPNIRRQLPPSAGGDMTFDANSPDARASMRYELGTDGGAPGQRSVSGRISQFEAVKLRIVDAEQSVNRYDTQIQKMFALAAACVVFVLVGAPIALRFPRGGVGLVIGVSLFVFSIYYIGLIAGETLAQSLYVAPVLAMWIVNIVLTIIGLIFLVRVSKSGATARGGDMGELWEALRGWIRRQAMRARVLGDRRHAGQA